jgi:hypothetical protein
MQDRLAYLNDIYTVLVEHAGALDLEREDFLDAHMSDRPPREWRFRGALGFGGKIYDATTTHLVGCHHDDVTERRKEICSVVNEHLARISRCRTSSQETRHGLA